MTVIAPHTSLVIILMIIKVSMVTVGTASEEPCVFPFLYKGTEYYDCTTEYHDSLWCSTTYKYEKKWRLCDSESSWSMSYYPQSVCALEGSTVEMSFSYTYPTHLRVQANWINSDRGSAPDISQLSQYRDRFRVNCRDKHCSLRINSVKRSDEGHYYCRVTTNVRKETRTKTPGVKMSVTGLKVVPPGRVTQGHHVTLTCSTTCTLTSSPSFIWSKDGRPVEKKQIINNQLQLHPVSREDEGDYTCAVRGHEDHPSPSERLSVMYPPQRMQIQISPSGEITERSRVTLTCISEADPPVHTYTWIKSSGDVLKSGNERTLTFSEIRSEDGGEHRCRAANRIGQQDSPAVSVRVLHSPKNIRIMFVPSGEITEGSRVTLTCMSEADPPVHTYTWIKQSGAVELKSGEEKTLTFSKIRSEDSGEFLCRATNRIGQQDSPSVTVQVLYAPKNTTVFIRPQGVMTLTLTCITDANPPVENYTWFKVNESTPVGSGQQYDFTSISSEDGGQYYCEARNKYGAEISTPVSVEGVQSPVMVTMVTVVTSVSVCVVLCLVCAAVWMGRYCCKAGRPQREDGNGGKSGVTQMRSVYYIRNPMTIQPDDIYQNREPMTIQPDDIYQNREPMTIQPDDIYQNVDFNTIQPDEDYENLN